MVRIGLVGTGHWGKILKKNLETFSKIIFCSNTKKTYKNKKKIDHCIVASNDRSHYKICNYFIKKKVPVFCEKPLTRNLEKCKRLIKFAKKNNTRLYVDHIELYKNKKIFLKKKNYIYRSKKSSTPLKDVLWKLCYHDLYLLYNFLKNKKIKVELISKCERKLVFKIIAGSKIFIFCYDLSNDKKKHYINNTSYSTKKNFVKKMLFSVINKHNKLNYEENHKQALFCVKTILLIQKKIF